MTGLPDAGGRQAKGGDVRARVFWPLLAAWFGITVAVVPVTLLTPGMGIGRDLTGIVVVTTHLGWLAAAIAVGVLVLPGRPTAPRVVVTLLATFASMTVGSEAATKAFLALHGRMPVDSGVDFAPLFAILFGVEGDIVIVIGFGVAAVVRAIRRRRPSSTESATRQRHHTIRPCQCPHAWHCRSEIDQHIIVLS